MGALVNKWTHVNIRWWSLALLTRRAKNTLPLSNYSGPVNARPGTTAADLCLYWLLRKKVNPLWIIVGFFVIGSLVTLAACWDCKTVVHYRGLWPRFFIWRINDNHGPGTDSFIAALLAFAIYDQFIMPRRKAPPCWQFLCSGVVASIALSCRIDCHSYL